MIALEGWRGPDLAATGPKLLHSLCRGKAEGGISSWDASNIFYDLRKGEAKDPNPSPRTLLLLYACDLAFRLRWEIQPAAAEGMIVIAVPYIESAVAFGHAAGLPESWLVELFNFAPKPHDCFRLKERRDSSEWKGKRSEGYLEFCCKTLTKASTFWNGPELHSRFLDHLEALEDRGACRTVTEKLLAKL